MDEAAEDRPDIAVRIARDSLGLLSSSLWSRSLAAVVSLVTARVLGPADFGILKVITLVPTLAKFGSFGFDGVAQRELPHLRVSGRAEAEARVRNVAFSADLAWAGLLGVAVTVVALFVERPVVRYALWIAAAIVVVVQVERLYVVLASVEKRFGLIARVSALGSFLGSITVLLTIQPLRIYAVLLGMLVTQLVMIGTYARSVRLGLDWRFDRGELRRQLRIALPLAGSTFAFGLFAWTERLAVLDLYGEAPLGIYMLFVTGFEFSLLLLDTLLRASSVEVYERLGKGADSMDAAGLVLKPTIALAYVFPLLGGVVWLLGPPLIEAVLPAYRAVIPLLPLLGVMLTLRGASALQVTAMNSSGLYMQKTTMVLQLGAVAVFACLTWAFAYMDVSLIGPAIAKAAAYGVVLVASQLLTRPYFFRTRGGFLSHQVHILGPLLYLVGVIALLNLVIPGFGPSAAAGKTVLLLLAYTPLFFVLERKIGIFGRLVT